MEHLFAIETGISYLEIQVPQKIVAMSYNRSRHDAFRSSYSWSNISTMHLLSVKIANIRSLRSAEWSVTAENAAGWHVIIGDNGSGKTTFVRSIALTLIGPEAFGLRQNWSAWLPQQVSHGQIHLTANLDTVFDSYFGAKDNPGSPAMMFGAKILRASDNSPALAADVNANLALNGIVFSGENIHSVKRMLSHVEGWFSAAYGPYRRFSGKNIGYEDISVTNPKLAAHLSLFDESFALGESLEWLQELKFKQLEKNPAGNLLDKITRFINQSGFLPHGTQLREVSSDGVTFADGNGYTLPVEDLSDGYRSVLSMTLELIRQMSRSYPSDALFSEDGTKVMPPGIVLIDEVDAHLHPSWQRKIGLWFREHFPDVQFIVTTHSPLVCQAAEHGSVWRLPKPGTDEQGGMVTGVELDRLLYGNILDACGTEMFGEDVARSESSQNKLMRLAELNRKELRSKLTASEQKEQQRLRATLPTMANAEDVEAVAR